MVQRTAAVLLAALILGTTMGTVVVRAQQSDELNRRAKSKVQPMYPELARKMHITGTVKVALVITPGGEVKDTKVLGGHPVLANAALEAVKKWRFEPAGGESTGVILFVFNAP